jgi:hypothetical protein
MPRPPLIHCMNTLLRAGRDWRAPRKMQRSRYRVAAWEAN